MEDHTPPVSDPFAFMMNPEAVLKAIEQSERLARLKRRICRPLDKPLIPKVGSESDEDTCAFEASSSQSVA